MQPKKCNSNQEKNTEIHTRMQEKQVNVGFTDINSQNLAKNTKQKDNKRHASFTCSLNFHAPTHSFCYSTSSFMKPNIQTSKNIMPDLPKKQKQGRQCRQWKQQVNAGLWSELGRLEPALFNERKKKQLGPQTPNSCHSFTHTHTFTQINVVFDTITWQESHFSHKMINLIINERIPLKWKYNSSKAFLKLTTKRKKKNQFQITWNSCISDLDYAAYKKVHSTGTSIMEQNSSTEVSKMFQ